MEIKIINKSNNPLPTYATKNSAGMDLRANIEAPIHIKPFSSAVIQTGIYIELPEGFEAQVRGRSGLAFKYGIISHVGTIDADYRGEINVKLFNFSNKKFVVHNGDRIAQLIISKYENVELIEVHKLSESERGDNGFGHTGIK